MNGKEVRKLRTRLKNLRAQQCAKLRLLPEVSDDEDGQRFALEAQIDEIDMFLREIASSKVTNFVDKATVTRTPKHFIDLCNEADEREKISDGDYIKITLGHTYYGLANASEKTDSDVACQSTSTYFVYIAPINKFFDLSNYKITTTDIPSVREELQTLLSQQDGQRQRLYDNAVRTNDQSTKTWKKICALEAQAHELRLYLDEFDDSWVDTLQGNIKVARTPLLFKQLCEKADVKQLVFPGSYIKIASVDSYNNDIEEGNPFNAYFINSANCGDNVGTEDSDDPEGSIYSFDDIDFSSGTATYFVYLAPTNKFYDLSNYEE